MKSPPIKSHWLERAIEINQFHLHQLRDDPSWTIEKSATALNRSIGSVAQDLLLARWSKTHDKQLKRCSSMRDALAWIRTKQREIRLEEIEDD